MLYEVITDPGSLDDHLPGGGLGTAVDWGEGAGFSAQALAVTEPLGNADGEVYGTHTFADNDAFVVTLRLCDDDECVTDALLANISNVAPTLTPVANQSIGDGTTWTDFTRITSYNVCYTKLLRSRLRAPRPAGSRRQGFPSSAVCRASASGALARVAA